MKNILLWTFIYTATLAFGQILLKIGVNRIGAFSAKSFGDLLLLGLNVLKNPYILFGTALMAGSYFLWLAMLSWFNLSLIYPLTAVGFLFVAVFSYLMLGETLALVNYFGVALIAAGIFFLLYKG
jgi:multidrug transporter EmrE-like cation transporter